MNNKKKEYIVVARAGSRLRFEPREQLEVTATIDGNNCIFKFQTLYVDEGFETPIPRELWIEARGPAPSLKFAAESFMNVANTFSNVISFCTNDYAGECQLHLAFDTTSGEPEREFFQQFIEEERGLAKPSRRINPKLVSTFITILGQHEERDRLQRAIVQYVLSLEHWKRGSEILATSHLFMGMEALVDLIIKNEIKKRSLSSLEELADCLGIPQIDNQKRFIDLKAKLRRDVLFKEDQETHQAAKKASDGMEHGFLSYVEIRPLAEKARDKAASYLRDAVIKLMELPEDVERELLSPPYNTPIGVIGYIRYFRGNLIADHDQLAQAGQEYPIVKWAFNLKDFSHKEKKLNLSFSQSITPLLGDRVSLKPWSIEIYGPEGIISEGPQEREIEPEIIRSDKEREALLSFLERVRKAVDEYGSNEFLKASPQIVIILSMFSRCKSLYLAIMSLLKKGLLEEGLILSGSLFLESLRLMQIAEAGEQWTARALGWAKESLRYEKKMMKSASKLGMDKHIQELLKKITERQRSLTKYAEMLGIPNLESLNSVGEAAVRFLDSESYLRYLEAHSLFLSSISVPTFKTRQIEEGKIVIESKTHDANVIAGVGCFAAEAALRSCRAIGQILGWPELAEFGSLLGEIKIVSESCENK